MGIDARFEEELIAKGLIPPRPGGSVSRPRPVERIETRLRFVVWISGLKTRSEANVGGKLKDKLGRKAEQKATVLAALPDVRIAFRLPTPVKLVWVSSGGRKRDSDNLRSSLKVVRDAVAEWLGVDDGDTSAVSWSYSQRLGYKPGVKIIVG